MRRSRSSTPRELAADLEPYRVWSRSGPGCRRSGTRFHARPGDGRVPGRGDGTCARRGRLRHAHGARRANVRADPHRGTGSCRDSAWLLVQVLRAFGLAARFVSGYLMQLAESRGRRAGPEGGLGRPACLGGGFSAGRGLDRAGSHVGPVRRGRAHSAGVHAEPVGGRADLRHGGAGAGGLQLQPDVRRLNEAPTLDKPFSEAEWARVRDVAHAVDRDLAAQDVRLTMGGEPTFVGIDEPESPQWNLEALGPIKRTRGAGADPAAARADRARRAAALRPGQVVPGRAAAALGLSVHLARGRRAGVGETPS